MLSPDIRLSCRLDHEPTSKWEQQRLQILEKMGLLELESVPVFEEATQTAAHFLDAPICILGILDSDRHLFKSAVGLSRIGLMNNLATSRQLPRAESFCTYVVDSQQVLAIPDTAANPVFANSLLTQRYGICAYLGVPLITSKGDCVGTLAVMELSPRNFTSKEIELLQLTARWSMSEFERDRLLKQSQEATFKSLPAVLPDPYTHFNTRLDTDLNTHLDAAPNTHLDSPSSSAPSSVKTSLISQMTQELCTPLTSILGMASVLSQGIYGSLSNKQKEYIEIIHNSGQHLLSLVNEIIELGALDDSTRSLNLSSVDIEMLCQQALAALNQAAQRREQQIQLTIEPGNRIWLLDKDKVRQMLYHLVFSVVQSSSADSVIRIHVSRRQGSLNLTIWTSHPWLGDGLPQAELVALNHLSSVRSGGNTSRSHATFSSRAIEDELEAQFFNGQFTVQSSTAPASAAQEAAELLRLDGSRQSLGLSLSRQLAEVHGGSVSIRGSSEDGYRYVIKLPQMQNEKEVL